MTLRIGTLRGLDACASETGKLSVLALDHRNNLRRMLGPTDPGAVPYDQLVAAKRAVVRALSGAASGILLDPELGAAQAVVDGSLPAATGLIVSVEATGYGGPSTARVTSLLSGWSVAQAKRMGADAEKAPVSTAASPVPPSSPGGKSWIRALACATTRASVCTRPLSTTTTSGVPVPATASINCCWTPVMSRLVASLPSPTVAGRSSPLLPATTTIATSASRAAATAAAKPERSSPSTSQPGA